MKNRLMSTALTGIIAATFPACNQTPSPRTESIQFSQLQSVVNQADELENKAIKLISELGKFPQKIRKVSDISYLEIKESSLSYLMKLESNHFLLGSISRESAENLDFLRPPQENELRITWQNELIRVSDHELCFQYSILQNQTVITYLDVKDNKILFSKPANNKEEEISEYYHQIERIDRNYFRTKQQSSEPDNPLIIASSRKFQSPL